MGPLAFRCFLLLSLTGLGLCATPADAQSPSKRESCCPPSESCDSPPTGETSTKIIIIADVAFEEPIHLSSSNLKQFVTSLKQQKFEVDSDWIKEIENELQSLWRDEGFFNIKVVARAVPLGNDGTYQRYSITAHVEEGLQYRVGRIEFQAVSNHESSKQPVFPIEELRSLIPFQEGDIFSARQIRQGLAAFHKLYAEHGYIDLVVTPLTEIDDEHRSIALMIELAEEHQFRIGKIEVSGLGDKPQKALTWDIRRGDVFNSALLEEFFYANQSLLPAGASGSRNVRLNRDVKNSTMDIAFNFSPCAGL
jgi:outer membrane protein assembly factor BamA